MKIGIDLGGSHIGIGIINENGKIIEKRETELINEKENNIEEFIKSYISYNVKELIQKYNDIKIIGVASPGTPKNGKITTLVNLGINELDIKEIISNVCNLPIRLCNDAKCAGLAEKQYGSLKKYSDAVFICLGTGIGGAVFLDNKLLIPRRNPGFELGHMIIEKDGKLCNCGKKGCFETYCSMKRLKNELIDEMSLPKDIPSQQLLQTLKKRKKEENVKQIVNTYIENLIVGLSNIIDIFEPEAICLGGSFVYFEEVLYESLVEKYYAKRYVFNKQNLPDIKLAQLGNDAGMIGAGELIWQNWENIV